MAENFWSEVGRLSALCAEAHAALDSFLSKTPAPRSDDELAEYDKFRDAAAEAHMNWTRYCEENENRRG